MSETHGSPETPGRAATPDEEAYVRALLGSLRDDDLPMPEDVWTRLQAVIAEERRSQGPRHLAGTPTALGDDADPVSAQSTIVPVADLASRRTRRMPLGWMVGAAAAVVVVLLGGGVVVGTMGGGSSSGGASNASSAPEVAGVSNLVGTAVTSETRSGTAYTRGSLATQVTTSLAAASSAKDASTGSAPATGSVTAAGQKPLLEGAALTACLTALTGTSTASAILVDRGTWAGADVDVIVLPTTGDATSIDVYVVHPTCTASSADIVQFSRLHRP